MQFFTGNMTTVTPANRYSVQKIIKIQEHKTISLDTMHNMKIISNM